jgi:ABC-type sugar transport system ATPase subunit
MSEHRISIDDVAKIQVEKRKEQSLSESPVIAELSNLTKFYSKGKIKALDGVSLTIAQGEIFGLIGPNGAGKTTVIGCLLGL